MKLIVGLGNPGKKYFNTRHNIGYLCVDRFATQAGLKFKKDRKLSGLYGKTQTYLLLKPTTYMNLSGVSVKAAMDYYDIDEDDVLIIYDDLDLPTAKLRLRYKGGSGGHKGLLSIMSSLGTDQFKRIRFGIDKHSTLEARNYVLNAFHKSELDDVLASIKTVSDIIEGFVKGTDFQTLMNQYNQTLDE